MPALEPQGRRSKPKRDGLAEDVIKWIEKVCIVPEGKWFGQPVKLLQFQKDIIIKIYDNPQGTRRAILSFPRKNAKTSLAAFLLMAHLCGPCLRRNSQLYSTAQSRDQAAVIFNLAAKMVRLSPLLSASITIRDTAKELLCHEMGTRYRALSAEAATNFGLSPSFIVHDELGQVRGPRIPLTKCATFKARHLLAGGPWAAGPKDRSKTVTVVTTAAAQPRRYVDLASVAQSVGGG